MTHQHLQLIIPNNNTLWLIYTHLICKNHMLQYNTFFKKVFLMVLKHRLYPKLRFDNITQKLKAQLEEQKRAHLKFKKDIELESVERLQSRMQAQMQSNPLKLALQRQKEAQLIKANTIQFQTEQGLMEQLELTYKV
ncbi:MAG: hypothetical protein EBQ95_07310 [Gammaproteobacteria bacterium]|nr:hypothetical protein [Gammaproteobacteria bacterium]